MKSLIKATHSLAICISNFMISDDLSPSRYQLRTPPRSSSQRRQLDLQLLAGQKVVKKYRRYARNNEFRRLKSIVPSLVKKNDASKVTLIFGITFGLLDSKVQSVHTK